MQLLDKSRSLSSASKVTNKNENDDQIETEAGNHQRNETKSEPEYETTQEIFLETVTEISTPSISIESTSAPKTRRSLVTRTNLYKSIERKLNA